MDVVKEKQAAGNNNKKNAATMQAPASSLDVFSIASMMSVSSALDDAGKAYVDAISQQIEAKNADGRCVISHYVTTMPFEAHIFHSNGFGIGLLFAEVTPAQQNGAPIAMAKQTLVHELQAKGTEVDANGKKLPIAPLDMVVVVDRASYPRWKAMANYIINEIMSNVMPEIANMTFESFRDANLVVSDDLNEVRKFINANSPHAVPARDDYGVIVYAERPRQNNFGMQGQFSRETERVPLLAITGYTHFYQENDKFVDGNMLVQYADCAVMTDVVAAIPSGALAMLAYAIGAESFVKRGLFRSRFNDFSPNAKYNIGRLINDEENKGPWRVSSPSQLEGFMRQYITTSLPALAIDITEGRARLYKLSELHPDQIGMFAADMVRLLNRSILNADGSLCMPVTVTGYPFFSGLVTTTAGDVDSRCIDYVTMRNEVSDNAALLPLLRANPNDPEEQLRTIRTWYKNGVEGYYYTWRAIVNPQMIAAIIGAFSGKLNVRYSFGQINPSVFGNGTFVSAANFDNIGTMASSGANTGFFGGSMF